MSQEELGANGGWQAKRWALLVGVNYYQDKAITNLRYCANDARALYDLLLSRPEYGYQPERLRLLISEDCGQSGATRLDILHKLIDTANGTDDEDLLLFYFSGHGEVVNGQAYLVPTDAASGRLLADTAISLRRIKEIVQGAKARTKVIIVDACHLGVGLRGKTLAGYGRQFVKSVFEEAEGIAVLASSARDERSWEDPEKGHSVFTY